jgi:hypothetical protein
VSVVSDVLLGVGLVWLFMSTLALYGWVNPKKPEDERDAAGARALADLWTFALFAVLAAALRFWPW